MNDEQLSKISDMMWRHRIEFLQQLYEVPPDRIHSVINGVIDHLRKQQSSTPTARGVNE